MKRFVVAFVFLAGLAVQALAQSSALEVMQQKVMQSCAYLEYSYTARVSGVTSTGSGTLSLQGDKWKMTGNGVEMYCDSRNVWVLDPVAKEVVIEPMQDDSQTFFMTNPALLLIDLQKAFTVNVSRPTDDGKAVFYSMIPVKSSDMEYLNLEILDAEATIRNGSFAMNDGTLVELKVASMKYLPTTSEKAFTPQMSFDKSWIVTDLR